MGGLTARHRLPHDLIAPANRCTARSSSYGIALGLLGTALLPKHSQRDATVQFRMDVLANAGPLWPSSPIVKTGTKCSLTCRS